jgi:hypothetical protein
MKNLGFWFYVKWAGGVLILLAAINQIIYASITKLIFSLYLIGGYLFLVGWIKDKRIKLFK